MPPTLPLPWQGLLLPASPPPQVPPLEPERENHCDVGEKGGVEVTKYKCPACGEVIKRNETTKTHRSYCDIIGDLVLCKVLKSAKRNTKRKGKKK